MKNIITILLVLVVPIVAYLVMSKNSDDLSAMANDRNHPSMLIFTSTMCMDCQKMKSILKEVEPQYSNKMNFVHINALDKNRKVQENIKKYQVVLVPTMVFVDENGNQTNKIEGSISKEALITEIEEAING